MNKLKEKLEPKYPNLEHMTKREQNNLLIAALEANANAIERNNALLRQLVEGKISKRRVRKSKQPI